MRISDWSSTCALPISVKIAVEGQDQRDVFGDVEIVRRDGDALGGQLLYLRLQRPGIEHHAIADNRQRAPHDAGRQQAELVGVLADDKRMAGRSEEHTSELQSLMRISYAVFCLKKKK